MSHNIMNPLALIEPTAMAQSDTNFDICSEPRFTKVNMYAWAHLENTHTRKGTPEAYNISYI